MGQVCSACSSGDERGKAAAFASSTTDAHDPQYSQAPSRGLQAPSSSSPAADLKNQNSRAPPSVDVGGEADRRAKDEEEGEEERRGRMERYRLEQAELARRESIVAEASRGMVPVGSQGSIANGRGMTTMTMTGGHRRGGTRGEGGVGIVTYYDPAYAAAAAQDILRSAAATGGLAFRDDKATRTAWKISVSGSLPLPSMSRDGGATPSNPKDVSESLGRGRWDGVRLGSRGSGIAGCGGEDPEYYLDDLAESFLEIVVPTKTSLFAGCASIVENLP